MQKLNFVFFELVPGREDGGHNKIWEFLVHSVFVEVRFKNVQFRAGGHEISTLNADPKLFQWVKDNLVSVSRWLKDGYIPFNFDWKNSHEEFTCNQWVNKTVYLFVPHHTDNMFHLHNDVITKLWTSVWGTGRANAPKTLWLLEGWKDRVKRSKIEFLSGVTKFEITKSRVKNL